MNALAHHLDVTTVTDREEVASAFGSAAAWRASITKLTEKEAKERDPKRKRYLRLMLLNAHTQLQLQLANEE